MSATNNTERSGIYQIRCLINGKVYIGSAIKFRVRWNLHRTNLKQGKHHSPYLQHAWNKYGSDEFAFEILEIVDDIGDLVVAEQRHMDVAQSFRSEFGYNVSRTAGSPLGIKRSQATRDKISAARTGSRMSEAQKAKLSEANLGKQRGPHTPEHNAKIGDAHRGRKHSDEARANMSAARKGRKFGPRSPESRARMSAAQKGRKLSVEQRAKISEIQRGKTLSPEHRAKISAGLKAAGHRPSQETCIAARKARTGSKHTADTRAKMSAAKKGRPVHPNSLAALERHRNRRNRQSITQATFAFMD